MSRRLLYVINEAYFFMAHRLPAVKAVEGLGFEIHVAAPAGHTWAPEGFEISQLSDAGFTFHELPLSRRGLNPIQELRTIFALWRIYRKLKPDMVHHLTIKPIIYGGLAARLAGVPVVIASVTGLGQIFVAKGFLASGLRKLVVWLYRLVTGHPRFRVLVENPDDRDTLDRLGAVPRSLTTVINGTGVPLDEFSPNPLPDGPPIVVLASRMIREKGIEDFVMAAELLKQRGRNVRMVLVGDSKADNPRSVSEAELQAWNDAGVVEWWGRREDIPAVFAQASVVCLPTRYGEGIPRSLIEAASCARPLVATDAPGCREIVQDGDNGLLVPIGDQIALANAIERLIEDPVLSERMGKRGRELVREKYSVETVINQTRAVYLDALGEPDLNK
jgi:glycosyltransferase involved in cell wall biosynthesis